MVETARYFIDGGGVMDRCDIIALRRSAPNRIRVQDAAGYKVQRAHPSELRHALGAATAIRSARIIRSSRG